MYYDLLGEGFDPETSKRYKVHQVDWNSVARYYKVYEIYLMKVEYFTQEDIDAVASKYADSADYVRAVWQHTNLLDALDSDPDELRRACEAAKGRKKSQRDLRAAEYDHDWRDKPSGKRILAFRTLGHRKIVILSRFLALSVSLTQKVSLFQTSSTSRCSSRPRS